MNKQEILQKIAEKKEFSKLPEKDIKKAFSIFERRQVSDEEKIKLIRDLLRKAYSVFTSEKLLSKNKNGKDKNLEPWRVLKKHISTRERFPYYKEIYSRIFKNFNLNERDKSKINVFDLGSGVNEFSYGYFPDNLNINYTGVEAIGQLVELGNVFFNKNKINGKMIHDSLFELSKIKELIKEKNWKKIVFLFKTLDSLEMLERDYSKKLLKEIIPLVNGVVVSFATHSLIARKKFNVSRNWILGFIKENFNILDEFEFGGEKYVVFTNEKPLT
ncbi:MAG: hypothetical protein AABX30_03610 [Nanoarchaeota archaeon]